MVEKIKVWRTIDLGNGLKNAADFLRVLSKSPFEVHESAMEFFGREDIFCAGSEVGDVDLVQMCPWQLGFKGSASYQEICDRAEELGLRLCVPEIGPQLRLQYVDQPSRDVLYLAMKPLRKSSFVLCIFSLSYSGMVLSINAHCSGERGTRYSDGEQFIFVAPRESLVASSKSVRIPSPLLLAVVLLVGILVGALLGALIKIF